MKRRTSIVWQEYLANVLKKRGARVAAALISRACSEHNRRERPGRSTSSASGTCRPAGPGTCADFLDRIRPELVLIEGLADATEPDPAHHAEGDQAADRHPGLHRYAAGPHAGLPLRPLQSRNTRRSAGPQENDARGRVHRPAVRHFPGACRTPEDRAAGDKRRSDGRGQAAESRARSRRRRLADPGAAAVAFYERIAELRRRSATTTPTGNAISSTTVADDSYRLAAVRARPGAARLRRTRRLWRAENLVREAYMRRRIEEAIAGGRASPRRSWRSSARFTPRCSPANSPR